MPGEPIPTTKMTADAFDAWLDARPDEQKFELYLGEIRAMTRERAAHAAAKFEVGRQFGNTLGRRAPCRAYVEGLSIRVSDTEVYHPDAAIDCGPIAPNATRMTAPAVVVEIMSPSSKGFDMSIKSAGYLRLPSLVAYVVIDLDAPRAMVAHPDAPPEILPPTASATFDLPGGARVTLDLAGVFEAAGVPVDEADG